MYPSAFAYVGDVVGHQYLDNLFTVVLPSGGYWLLNSLVFERVKAGDKISILLKPLLLGAGDEDYKKNKKAKVAEIGSLEGLLELL